MSLISEPTVELESAASNRWLLNGRLDFATVPLAWKRLAPLLSVSGPLVLSLEGVTGSNSAALAMLIQALEQANSAGCSLKFVGFPPDLMALAKMCNCDDLLVGA